MWGPSGLDGAISEMKSLLPGQWHGVDSEHRAGGEELAL